MDDAQIAAGIARFDRWHYQFELGERKTPIFQLDHINRHAQREQYFFAPLVAMLGGSLAGKRVLDLGCNAGFWALRAIEHGCAYVLGIDGRAMHIDQANFVFEAKGVAQARYDFVRGDIFEVLKGGLGQFEVVLCCGLMYHISKPVTLLEQITALNTDVLVIDTALSEMPGAVFEMRRESLEDPRHALDYEQVLVPSRAAVLALARQFGYRAVTLRPRFTDYTGCPDYRDGYRRAFICAKQTDLGQLDTEADPPGL